MDNRLFGLVLVFAPLSILSFGGGQAIIADMQHQTVAVQGWLDDKQFVDLFALSRAAPGPSTLIAALIGWQVAGFLGAVVATVSIYVPSSILMYAATKWWHARADSPWRRVLEQGLSPIAVGLVFAGAASVLQAAQVNALQLVTVAVAAALLLYTKIGPYTLMGIVAAVYAVVALV